MEWYQMNPEQILESFSTSEMGLSEQEAARRLEQYGPDKLEKEVGVSRLKILLHQFADI